MPVNRVKGLGRLFPLIYASIKTRAYDNKMLAGKHRLLIGKQEGKEKYHRVVRIIEEKFLSL